jgi:hypothetical protein
MPRIVAPVAALAAVVLALVAHRLHVVRVDHRALVVAVNAELRAAAVKEAATRVAALGEAPMEALTKFSPGGVRGHSCFNRR